MLQPIRLVADVAKAGIKKTGEAVKIMTGEEDFHFGSTIRCAASWVTGDKRPYPKLSPDNHHGVAVDGRRVKVRPHALPCNSLLLRRVIRNPSPSFPSLSLARSLSLVRSLPE